MTTRFSINSFGEPHETPQEDRRLRNPQSLGPLPRRHGRLGQISARPAPRQVRLLDRGMHRQMESDVFPLAKQLAAGNVVVCQPGRPPGVFDLAGLINKRYRLIRAARSASISALCRPREVSRFRCAYSAMTVCSRSFSNSATVRKSFGWLASQLVATM